MPIAHWIYAASEPSGNGDFRKVPETVRPTGFYAEDVSFDGDCFIVAGTSARTGKPQEYRIGTAEVEGLMVPVGYKVVKVEEDGLKSLGLNRNEKKRPSNIMTFVPGVWAREQGELLEGPIQWGGITAAIDMHGAGNAVDHMMKQYGAQTKTYLTALGEKILHVNSYRIKSDAVLLLREV